MKALQLELRVNKEIKGMRLDKLRGLSKVLMAEYKKTNNDFYKKLNYKVLDAMSKILGTNDNIVGEMNRRNN